MTRLAPPLTLLAVAVLLQACATGAGSGSASKAADTGVLLTDIESSAKLGYRIAWQTTAGLEAGERVTAVYPMGEVIILRESGNILSMLNEATGAVRWRKAIGTETERFHAPVKLDEHLLVCSQTRAYFLRLDSGALDRAIELKRNASTAPLVSRGNMILGSPSGRVIAQDLEHGHPYWQYQMGGAIAARPIEMDGLILVADQTGGVAMINANDGDILWRAQNPPWDHISAQPTGGETIAYVASEDQKLYAFERNSGLILWQYLTEHPLTADPVVLGDHLYQRTGQRGLVCLDALSGEEIWRSDVPGEVMQQTHRTLVLRDGNTMNSVDIDSGELIESADWPKAEMIVPASVTGGPLYLAHSDGRIMKLTPR